MSGFVISTSDHGSMIINTNDTGVGWQIANFGVHEPLVVEFGMKMATACYKGYGRGVQILDVGANMGSCTVPWGRHTLGWGYVTAYEPQEFAYYALCGNIAINNLVNCRAKNVVVGTNPHTMKIPVMNYTTRGNFGGLHLREADNSPNGPDQRVSYHEEHMLETRVQSLDNESLARADILKIDVEGMEVDVLKGAAYLIGTHEPVIIAEYIHCGDKAITDVLGKAYEYFQLGGNVLCVPKSKDDLVKFVASAKKSDLVE